MHENVAPPWFVAVTFPPDRSLPFHTTPTLTCTAARLKSCRMLSGSGERGEGDCGSWAAWLQALLTGLSNNLPGAGGAGGGEWWASQTPETTVLRNLKGWGNRRLLHCCGTSSSLVSIKPESITLTPSASISVFLLVWQSMKNVHQWDQSGQWRFRVLWLVLLSLSLHLSQSEITELPSHHRTHRRPLLLSHIIPWLRMCCVLQKKKFTSSYRQEMTNATFFMRRIKNSKDLFPSLHSETQGKKTSLNNGWEKGLLRKESRCGMIEQRGARRGGRRG